MPVMFSLQPVVWTLETGTFKEGGGCQSYTDVALVIFIEMSTEGTPLERCRVNIKPRKTK